MIQQMPLPRELPMLTSIITRERLNAQNLRMDRAFVDDTSGIHLHTVGGKRIYSIDELRTACGVAPPWRRSLIAPASLSFREQAVDELVRASQNTATIAQALGVSKRTISTIRASIRAKAKTQSAVDGKPHSIAVIGQPGLLRDLVHECVRAEGIQVNKVGQARVDDSLRIMVLPATGDFDAKDHVRAVTIGSLPDSVGLVGAIQSGVMSVLPTTSSPSLLLETIETALAGRAALSEELVQRLVEELWQRDMRGLGFTRREGEVLDALHNFESVKQTARKLGLSEKTVENVRRQVYRKLGVRSAAEARARTRRVHGTIGPEHGDAGADTVTP